MDDPPGSVPSPYEGLQVKSADLFPLSCPRCQRRFTDIKDYLARTTPLFCSSGLMARDEPGAGTFVLLIRNCLCGHVLPLRCHDRRSQSETGQRRRSRFGMLVALLRETGVEPSQAEAEARRLLQSTAA